MNNNDVRVCKFVITPLQSNDTGSDNGWQLTVSSQRQQALMLTATGYVVYIQPLDPPPHHPTIPTHTHKHHIQFIYGLIFVRIQLHKRGRDSLRSMSFSAGCISWGRKRPQSQRDGAAVIDGRCGSHQRAPASWDCISLHPLFLSPAVIPGERLSCSHVLITEMWLDSVIRLNCWHKALGQMVPFDSGPKCFLHWQEAQFLLLFMKISSTGKKRDLLSLKWVSLVAVVIVRRKKSHSFAALHLVGAVGLVFNVQTHH